MASLVTKAQLLEVSIDTHRHTIHPHLYIYILYLYYTYTIHTQYIHNTYTIHTQYIHNSYIHYITLHHITLHYVTLRYITLHYITYIHTYIYIYICETQNTYMCKYAWFLRIGLSRLYPVNSWFDWCGWRLQGNIASALFDCGLCRWSWANRPIGCTWLIDLLDWNMALQSRQIGCWCGLLSIRTPHAWWPLVSTCRIGFKVMFLSADWLICWIMLELYLCRGLLLIRLFTLYACISAHALCTDMRSILRGGASEGFHSNMQKKRLQG